MKICFVGIGSIAKRHINNLRYIASQRKLDLQIDAFRRSLSYIDGIDHVFTTFEELPNDYDAVFITNPTDAHLEALRMMQQKGRNFFIEKPVVALNQVDSAKKIKLYSDAIYYVACPLRYSAVIQYIKHHMNLENIISVRSISSSYLPDWRPGKDYRDTYSAHRNMGGGVSIDLIHEWDYLTYLFGWPERIQCFIGKKSKLELDSDDYAIYIAECRDKIIELHLDYFGRQTVREIELFTGEETVVGDLVKNRIIFLKSGQALDFNEVRDDYQRREIDHFLNMILQIDEPEDGFHHALNVLELTQGKLLQ